MIFLKYFLINYFFLIFTFHYLVCLRVNLLYFIQFFLYRVIMISWQSHEFDMLARVRLCLTLFFLFNLSFNVWFVVNWTSNFYFIYPCRRLTRTHLIFILLTNKIIETFKKYLDDIFFNIIKCTKWCGRKRHLVVVFLFGIGSVFINFIIFLFEFFIF